MFFGAERQNKSIDESKIRDVVTAEIYTAILDLINIITERKGATKYQERVAREFYMGLQEVVKNTVEETLKNILVQNQKLTQQRRGRKTRKPELEPE